MVVYSLTSSLYDRYVLNTYEFSVENQILIIHLLFVTKKILIIKTYVLSTLKQKKKNSQLFPLFPHSTGAFNIISSFPAIFTKFSAQKRTEITAALQMINMQCLVST